MLLRILGLLSIFVQLIAASAVKHYKPRLFYIRHGEEAPHGGVGLSDEGKQRSMCIVDIFSQNSEYGITHIIAPTPLKAGIHCRSFDTVTPLARSLGLEVDIHCDRDDHKCVADFVRHYKGPGNILMAWQHDALKGVAKELGYHHLPKSPHGHFDLIWEYPQHLGQKFHYGKECCPGLDKCGRKHRFALDEDMDAVDEYEFNEDIEMIDEPELTIQQDL